MAEGAVDGRRGHRAQEWTCTRYAPGRLEARFEAVVKICEALTLLRRTGFIALVVAGAAAKIPAALGFETTRHVCRVDASVRTLEHPASPACSPCGPVAWETARQLIDQAKPHIYPGWRRAVARGAPRGGGSQRRTAGRRGQTRSAAARRKCRRCRAAPRRKARRRRCRDPERPSPGGIVVDAPRSALAIAESAHPNGAARRIKSMPTPSAAARRTPTTQAVFAETRKLARPQEMNGRGGMP